MIHIFGISIWPLYIILKQFRNSLEVVIRVESVQ